MSRGHVLMVIGLRPIVPLALVLALVGCGDRKPAAGPSPRGQRFATLAEARKAGPAEQGWIPQWVPAGANEIEEAHDLQTNRQRLRFKAPAAELAALGNLLPRLHISLLCSSRNAPPIAGPWPAALEAGAAAWSHRYLRDGASLAIAVEDSTSTVYAWSCAKPIPER